MTTAVWEDWEKSLIDELYAIGVWKFGKFTLKTGLVTPIYIDLRFLVTYPALLKKIGAQIWNKMCQEKIQYDCICGVPYAALPFASIVSFNHDIPMLIRRKEAKHYGTARLIEGVITENQKSLIIEDVVVFGHSILETVKVLREHKLKVTDAIVVFNREQGADNLLMSDGIKLHSVLTLSRTLDYLLKTAAITQQIFNDVHIFIKANNIAPPIDDTVTNNAIIRPLSDRILTTKHRHLQRLYEIMLEKKTNVCLAADYTDALTILNVVSAVGSEICLLKLHSDMIDNFSVSFVEKLKKLSDNLNFLIIEDRKFSDTGIVVNGQLNCNVFDITSWAHFITIHSIVSPCIFDSLRETCKKKNVVCLMVLDPKLKEVFSENNDDDTYVSNSIQLAQTNSDIVAGFISSNKRLPTSGGNFIHLATNVRFDKSDHSNSKYSNWCSPQEAIRVNGNDIIIISQGFSTEAKDYHSVIQQYKSIGWQLLVD